MHPAAVISKPVCAEAGREQTRPVQYSREHAIAVSGNPVASLAAWSCPPLPNSLPLPTLSQNVGNHRHFPSQTAALKNGLAHSNAVVATCPKVGGQARPKAFPVRPFPLAWNTWSMSAAPALSHPAFRRRSSCDSRLGYGSNPGRRQPILCGYVIRTRWVWV